MASLAISLLNRNGLSDTIDCVDSLLQSTFQDFDIYILDNGSQNKEYEHLQKKYMKYPNIFLTGLSKNIGFTGGNNKNLSLMQGKSYDYVVLLNNDCKIQKDFFGICIQKIEETKKVGIFGPIIRGYHGSVQAIGSFMNLRTGSSTRLKTIHGPYQQVDYVTGSCMFIYKEVVEKVGLLDDRYFAYWEESDYCLRAKKSGYTTYAVNIHGIYHKEESAHKKVKPYYTYLMFRNRILFLKKHANVLQYCVSYLVLLVYLFFLFPRAFGLRNYRYAFRGIWDGIRGIGGPFRV